MDTDPRGRPYALDVIRTWPDAARAAAHQIILVHGSPHHLDGHSLRWDHIGPWQRVVVCADDGDDDPDDVVESVIETTVPDARRTVIEEVAGEFRIVFEGDGELSVRGPDLHVNAITLNVVHAMVVDGLAPQAARERRSRDLVGLRDGHPPEDADQLHFADDAPHGEPRPISSDVIDEASPNAVGGTGST